jgi:hypothetical protein
VAISTRTAPGNLVFESARSPSSTCPNTHLTTALPSIEAGKLQSSQKHDKRRQKTPSGYYFRFGSAIFENGRQSFIRCLWPVRNPDQIEFHAGDAQNPSSKLLPVCCRHVAKWPLTAKVAFSRTKGPCSDEKRRPRRRNRRRITTSGLGSAILENARHRIFESSQPTGGPSHPQFKAAIEPTIPSRMTLPMPYVQARRIALLY